MRLEGVCCDQVFPDDLRHSDKKHEGGEWGKHLSNKMLDLKEGGVIRQTAKPSGKPHEPGSTAPPPPSGIIS